MPAPVGSGFANTGTAQNPETLTVTMAAGREAVAGNLLVAIANSDFTMPTPTGYTLAVSASDSQVMHIWYKIAAGGETSVTFNSDSPFRPMAGALLEYPDIAAAPLDKTASATRSATSSASQATGTTAATAQADEVIVVAVGPHSYTTTPADNTWSNSYTNRGGGGTTNSSTSTRCALFVGDKTVAATGTQTSTGTWTNNSDDAGGAIATFKLTAGGLALAGVASAAASATGTLSTTAALTSSAPVACSASASLSATVPVSAIAQIACSASGTLVAEPQLAGSSDNASFAISTLATAVALISIASSSASTRAILTNPGGGSPFPGFDLPYTLNRLAGTTGLDSDGAANVWAGTANLSLVKALNTKAGTNGVELNGVCRTLAGQLGGNPDLDGPGALSEIPT